MTTVPSVPPLRWWGWGDRDVDVPTGLIDLLRDEVGAGDSVVARAPRIEDVALADAALPAGLRRRLVKAVGTAHVHAEREDRIRHAAGRSYLDLVELRSGRLDAAPDAVVYPASSEEVRAVLRGCSDTRCAVVPFGGGTSVVGGVSPARGGCEALIAVDVSRLDALHDLDRASLVVTLGAGMRGPRIESELAARGLTLGHFPQSFEYATAGGFAATRSAGQASTGYGRFDELARGLVCETPAGEIAVRAAPPSATGPSLLQLLLGSEGVFGIITEVAVRVHQLPAVRHYAAWSLPCLESGTEALRELAQSRRLPDVARLSDASETHVSFAMAHGRLASVARRYLRVRGHADGCIAIMGWEGSGAAVGTRVRLAMPALRRHGAVALGSAPARSWLRDRFLAPYLRDALLDRGVLAETLETVAVWSRLLVVREAVVDALQRALSHSGSRALVGCHVSHVYPEGASLYFTVLAKQPADGKVDQWLAAKRAATDAMLAAGGSLSHHHGVGMDHAAWLDREDGRVGIAALRALKAKLDPAGVMNPGKLLV